MQSVKESILEILFQEQALHQAYSDKIPLFPVFLRGKMQGWIGEEWKHVEAVKQVLEIEKWAPPVGRPADVPVAPKGETEIHAILDRLYQMEEQLFSDYQEALREIGGFEQEETKAERLRAVLVPHLEDHERRLATIRRLYSDFFYY
ncbi:MAG: hypothetical protein WAO55_16395 [Candidatus Manganitrophaceae bacterium]